MWLMCVTLGKHENCFPPDVQQHHLVSVVQHSPHADGCGGPSGPGKAFIPHESPGKFASGCM